jgi:hypothetical protein
MVVLGTIALMHVVVMIRLIAVLGTIALMQVMVVTLLIQTEEMTPSMPG